MPAEILQNKLLQQAWASLPQWRAILPQLPVKLNDYERITKQMNAQLKQINRELQQSKRCQQYLMAILALIGVIGMVLFILH